MKIQYFLTEMVKYIENYALFEEIGSGVYGKVYRAVNNKDSKQYAIKVIPIAKFRENKKLEECTVNQINILTNIESNKHIIKYFDMLKTCNNFYFIYEYCNGGTLDQIITKQTKIPEPRALQIFSELLQAFKILNKYNILHRDLKPDNIFFHDGVIKLGDFGFCKNLESADQMTKTMLGSPIYMAPEVIKGQVYSNKADIWSLGVVLYEMLFGHCPFMSNSIAKLIQVLNTQKLTFPSQVSPFVQNLLQRMLTKDPLARIGWLQLFVLKINPDGQPDTSSINKGKKTMNSLEDVALSPQETNGVGNVVNANSGYRGDANIDSASNFKKIKKSPNFNGNNSGHTTDTVSGPDTVNAIQHKKVVQGIKLAMELVGSKMPNCMGYGYLVLIHTIKLLNDQHDGCRNSEIKGILASELRESKRQQEALGKKMFAYQLKGIEDWKKYLRGKFFEQQSTITFWYRMVTFIDGKYNPPMNLNSKMMTDTIKKILY